MKDLARLKAVCDAIIADPKLAPKKDEAGKVIETYCNFGAIRSANAMDCHELNGLNADAQHAVMLANKSGKWAKVLGFAASLHAQAGGLAFASMTGPMLKSAHGHIATIYPAPMEDSPSLGRKVPMVANIGKDNAEVKESAAFPVAFGEPDYFVYNG